MILVDHDLCSDLYNAICLIRAMHYCFLFSVNKAELKVVVLAALSVTKL